VKDESKENCSEESFHEDSNADWFHLVRAAAAA
jgi:hypothetical protein